MLNRIYISSTEVASRKPFIYFIAILKPVALLYVGQTCQRYGVLGRFFQHLEPDGTLRNRAIEAGIDDFENISIIAVDLSKHNKFGNAYNRYRDALEFLLHCEMKAKGCKSKIPFEVISNVRANIFVNDFELQKLSKEIANEIVDELPYNK